MRRTPLRKVSPNKIPKKKEQGKKALHKKLWKIFSLYIRQRDGFICFTCGKKTWPAQAGHYRTGATCRKYLFYDERNVNCQCYQCNINLSGNWREYQKRMHAKYGPEVDKEFDEINLRDGWDFPYQEKIDHYSKLIKQ